MKTTLVRTAWIALVAGTIAGCGGDGGGGDAAPPPVITPPPVTGPAPAPVPPGSTTIDAGALSTTQFSTLAPQVVFGGATVGSPPKISFALQDANGNPIVGIGKATRLRATDSVASYMNIYFTIAKLVPGANGAPSKWVSYVVTTVPSKDAQGVVGTSAPTRPGSDNTGTLVDNGNGTYVYTFYRDITKVKDEVAAMSASGKEALGDLTYDANAVHRIALVVSGDVPGTGSNTPDGSDSGVPRVRMQNPINAFYDFIPATGKAVAAADPSREIVATAKCNECHDKLGGGPGNSTAASPAAFHGGARNDTRLCVTCHTSQRGYGRTEATISGNTFSGSTYVVDGRTIGDLPNFVHKTHLGEHLAKKSYNYANVVFNHVTYPQDIKNCTKCHDGAGTSNKTANGDNWKAVPSRLACGACHDGINFATGKGVTLADAREGMTTSQYGHIGGAQADDKNCALCHSADAVPVYHVTVDPEGSEGRGGYPVNTATDTPTPGYPRGQGPGIPLASQLGKLPDGVYKINFEIKQVTVANNVATVVYRILKDGAPVTLNATGYLIDGVDGTPSIYLAYAVPQDGIASPADWNATGSANIDALRDGTDGTQTGPDASGYYTAVLSNDVLPAGAKLVTAALGINYQGFVQLNLAEFPKGIRLREPEFVMKVADGFTGRRAIVDNAKCNACHGQLGVSPSFHSGARNNGTGCAICHDPNRATGHTGASNNFGGGWSVQSKNLIHGIHGGSKRDQHFTYEATAENPDGFAEVTFPGILKNCETCHVAGSYDFSASSNSAALPNLLWTTDAKGDMRNPNNVTSIGLSPWVTTLGRGQVDYRTDNLVSSPLASSCFGCHDDSLAVQHMQQNGGTLVTSFSGVAQLGQGETQRPAVGAASSMTFTRSETCILCHASGKVADIKAMHAK